jgi:ABC-type transport system involved in multi-copper enzyme maturation permease subunit
MRPYLAIIKDSFREALASRVLWVLLVLITLTLLAFAPLTYREEATIGVRERDVEAWPLLIEKLRQVSTIDEPGPVHRIWSMLDDEGKKTVEQFKKIPDPPTLRDIREMQRAGRAFFKSLDKAVRSEDFYDEPSFRSVPTSRELKDLLKTPYDKLARKDRLRVNRLLLEASFPDLIGSSNSSSLVLRYAVWDLSQPFPVRKQQFTEALFKNLPFFIDKFILSIGLLIAVLVTAPIIPQTLDPGSLHLLLSKPIARSLLYISKFLGGCAFVLLSATYLFVGMWLIFGWQWRIWESQILWCIPVYTFVFATYYSVAALAGAIWRNTIVAVIITCLFWATCFSLGTSDAKLGGVIMRYRVSRIEPAGDDLLAADEVNTLLVWDDEKHDWKPRFTSNEHEQIRSVLILAVLLPTPVPFPPPMIGPAYDAKNEQIVAVAPSLKMFNQMVFVSARKLTDWKAVEGAPSRGQPIAIVPEPDGHQLLITNTGASRIVRDLATPAVMVRLPGFSLPLSRAEALEDAGPSPAPYWGSPAAAAIDQHTGNLYIYTRGEINLLTTNDSGKYSVARQEKLESDEKQSALLAAAQDKCFLISKDLRVVCLNGKTLAATAEYKLPGESPPRTTAATADGKRLFVLSHEGVLRELDPATGHWSRSRVRGQGDISAFTVAPSGKLFVASRATRVAEYDLATMKPLRSFYPAFTIQERLYYYLIHPAHALLPKPGEFYKTVQYLLAGQKTAGIDDNNLATAQTKLDPWSPILSGLAFQVLMLLLGCAYLHWQEF